jgi:hypothetical protein
VPTRGSQFWNGIQKIKWHFKLGAKHKVHNGKHTFFWLDWWVGNSPVRARFPLLFSYCSNLFITVYGTRGMGAERPGNGGSTFTANLASRNWSNGTTYAVRSKAYLLERRPAPSLGPLRPPGFSPLALCT